MDASATATPDTPVTPKKEWEDRFLEVFEDSGIIAEAARAVGISRATLYRHKKRSPEFAARLAEVEEWSTEELEQVAYKRAREGSDTLMIFLLKSRRPETYRETVGFKHSGKVTVEVEEGVDEGVNAALAEVDRLTARLAEVAPAGETPVSGGAEGADLAPAGQPGPDGT